MTDTEQHETTEQAERGAPMSTRQITARDCIWNFIADVPRKGRTYSEIKAAYPDMARATISSTLTTLEMAGHLREKGKRPGPNKRETVYVANLDNPFVTKAERRLRRRTPRPAQPKAPAPAPARATATTHSDDWLEGYTDALLGRPSVLSDYADGYAAGMAAREEG